MRAKQELCPVLVQENVRRGAHSFWFWGVAIFVGRSMCECVFSIPSTEDLAQILLLWWKLLWIPLGDIWIMRRHRSWNEGRRRADLCLGACVYQATWVACEIIFCPYAEKGLRAPHDSRKQQLAIVCCSCVYFWMHKTRSRTYFLFLEACAGCLLAG